METIDREKIQRMAVKIVATSHVGHNLLLIGGFRFRLLDQSARHSQDIDYHWDGDLDRKQQELLHLCRRSLLPQVRRELGYEGMADVPKGPEAESAKARFVELRFWKLRIAGSQILIPLELTRIVCLDPTTVRTAEGVVYPTPSDTDLIESKIVAGLNRIYLEHRDLVDIFLYGGWLVRNSPERLKQKLQSLQINPASVRRRFLDLEQNAEFHAKAVQEIIDHQLDPIAAAQIKSGGGGKAVFEQALRLIQENVSL